MLKDILKDIKGVIFDLDGTLLDSMFIWDIAAILPSCKKTVLFE